MWARVHKNTVLLLWCFVHIEEHVPKMITIHDLFSTAKTKKHGIFVFDASTHFPLLCMNVDRNWRQLWSHLRRLLLSTLPPKKLFVNWEHNWKMMDGARVVVFVGRMGRIGKCTYKYWICKKNVSTIPDIVENVQLKSLSSLSSLAVLVSEKWLVMNDWQKLLLVLASLCPINCTLYIV